MSFWDVLQYTKCHLEESPLLRSQSQAAVSVQEVGQVVEVVAAVVAAAVAAAPHQAGKCVARPV